MKCTGDFLPLASSTPEVTYCPSASIPLYSLAPLSTTFNLNCPSIKLQMASFFIFLYVAMIHAHSSSYRPVNAKTKLEPRLFFLNLTAYTWACTCWDIPQVSQTQVPVTSHNQGLLPHPPFPPNLDHGQKSQILSPHVLMPHLHEGPLIHPPESFHPQPHCVHSSKSL